MEAVEALGKMLVRRGHAQCELCQTGHRQLTVVEVPPLPEEPDAEHAVFLCEQCRNGVEGEKNLDSNYWHFLPSVIWSEVVPVQVTAVRLCRKLEEQGISWASEALADLYLPPDVEKLLKE